jgi:hypothetical protein
MARCTISRSFLRSSYVELIKIWYFFTPGIQFFLPHTLLSITLSISFVFLTAQITARNDIDKTEAITLLHSA